MTHAAEPGEEPFGEQPALVRAYAWTGGRARTGRKLEIETLVTATDLALIRLEELSSEHESVARLCHQAISVAEVSALLRLPLGVVRVLLDDMALLGLLDVHRTAAGTDERLQLELLERVRQGLVNLRI